MKPVPIKTIDQQNMRVGIKRPWEVSGNLSYELGFLVTHWDGISSGQANKALLRRHTKRRRV